MKKHQNVNLLFFLNAIIGSVLESLTGEFTQRAKQKFSILVKGTNQLEKELLKGCDYLAQETYSKSSLAVASVLNEFMDAYNEGNMDEFIDYVKQFKNK